MYEHVPLISSFGACGNSCFGAVFGSVCSQIIDVGEHLSRLSLGNGLVSVSEITFLTDLILIFSAVRANGWG